ncbi:MAG: hypothetical protein ACLTMP_00625 [Eggerthella lenta]
MESNLLVADENATTVFLDVGDRGFDAGAVPKKPSAPKRRISRGREPRRRGSSHLFSFKGWPPVAHHRAFVRAPWEQTDDDKKIVLQVKTGQNGAIESVSVSWQQGGAHMSGFSMRRRKARERIRAEARAGLRRSALPR